MLKALSDITVAIGKRFWYQKRFDSKSDIGSVVSENEISSFSDK